MTQDWLYFGAAAERLSTGHGYRLTTRHIARMVRKGALREVPRPGYDNAWRRVSVSSLEAYEVEHFGRVATAKAG